jgi:hypothetical protein
VYCSLQNELHFFTVILNKMGTSFLNIIETFKLINDPVLYIESNCTFVTGI